MNLNLTRREAIAAFAAATTQAASRLPANQNVKWAVSAALWGQGRRVHLGLYRSRGEGGSLRTQAGDAGRVLAGAGCSAGGAEGDRHPPNGRHAGETGHTGRGGL